MICATGKKISEILAEIHDQYGIMFTEEADFKFRSEVKEKLVKVLFEDKKLPEFGYPVKNISYKDGAKVYFENDGWVIARFSGTEPLLRIFAEMPEKEQAREMINKMQKFLGL
jgi:phosphomannomutase